MFVVCFRHIEDAIDEFIEVYEQPPDLYELEKTSFGEWTKPNHCDFCENDPKYLIV